MKDLNETAELWWDNLSDEEAKQAQKDYGIYGHDQGVTLDDIREMYKYFHPKTSKDEKISKHKK